MRTKSMMIVAVLVLTVQTFAAVTVTNVTCQQRYPWNGLVDINYEIRSDDAEGQYFVYPKGEDKRLGTPIVMHTLSGDGATNAVGVGTHRMIWDAKADMPNFSTPDFTVTLQAISQGAQYLVVDLSGGTNAVTYPVRYSTTPPDVTTDKCRTTELWLRLVLPGTFMMGSPTTEYLRDSDEQQHSVRLTHPYYIGVFELTQKQWLLIRGTPNGQYSGDCRPVDRVSYDMIRGTNLGAQWPQYSDLDDDSFMGIMRRKTSLKFDLPTEAQWEYACRAGSKNSWNSGKEGEYFYLSGHGSDYGNRELSNLGRYIANRNDGHDSYEEHTKVGLYRPNAWGLYDMHGNVIEWCLDGYKSIMADYEEIDPVGADSTEKRCLRGGNYGSKAQFCRSADRGGEKSNVTGYWDGKNYAGIGFRVVCLPVE